MSNPLLNSKEAAILLCVKVSTLYSWVHKRKIPFRKHGSKLVFSRESLLVWGEGCSIKPESSLTFSCFEIIEVPNRDSLKIEDKETEGLASGTED